MDALLLSEVTYALVPLNMFINQILTNNYFIVYHLVNTCLLYFIISAETLLLQ
jgi:hypothetical protein